ncbi:Heavy metal transport/detoxification superfamily protein [Striga hermonthica]|uniref:Heavy metal transport/detoxification superfamily protein n=1 Tax=Striga hermonthica TaxID=68872 RepID=A0A9N7R8F7_STRHE|nr:Heavy metal transport/detoxification superfamily protein [Striga hermonthica]
MVEKKKPEEPKKEEDKPEADKPPPAEGGKKEEKKSEEPKSEEKAAAVPPLPPEIVLKVYMHCEGCARKVRRCLKGFEGVEDVITDCKASRVVVRGEKADPVKVLDRVQRKSHRQVELISPIPKPPPPEEPKKTGVKDVPKADDKKPEPAVVTVVLGVYMHCEACAQEIKKRILKMKGVESVEPELKSSQVKVKGTIEPEKLVDHVYKRTGKHATVVKVEPEKKKEDEKPKEGKEDKKSEEGEKGKKEAEKEAAKTAGGGGGEQLSPVEAEEDSKLELRKNESNYCYPQQQNHQFYPQFYPPQRFVQETYSYPPQMFSDENPNACTVM